MVTLIQRRHWNGRTGLCCVALRCCTAMPRAQADRGPGGGFKRRVVMLRVRPLTDD